jgi:hypothetical protein
MNLISNLKSSRIQAREYEGRPAAASIEQLVSDVFSSAPSFVKRFERIESEIAALKKGNVREVETAEGPMKVHGASSLLKTGDGFVLKLLNEFGIPDQDWAQGHLRKDGLLATFDGQSGEISVREIRVRPNRVGFGKQRRTEDIGAVTTYKLDLAKHVVSDLKIEEFKGQGSEAQWADFRVAR